MRRLLIDAVVLHERVRACSRVVLTVDLQHGRHRRFSHAVLRCAGVCPFILLFHSEQAQVVAVADFKPEDEEISILRAVKTGTKIPKNNVISELFISLLLIVNVTVAN